MCVRRTWVRMARHTMGSLAIQPNSRRGHALALALLAAALVLQWSLRPLLGTQVPFLFLLPAIAIAAMWGGWRPAPELTGNEVARAIRERESDRRMLLVAITGWGQERDRRAARAAGFDVHFTKPVDPRQVLDLLARTPAGAAPPGTVLPVS